MKNSTYLIRLILLCVILTNGSLYAQQIEKHLTLPNKEEIGFLEYKPANYSTEGNVKHPVIIFLHGIGERGNGTTQLKNVARIGLPRMIRMGHDMKFTWNGKSETFLVISPQCPKKYSMWPELLVNEMVNYAKQNLRADTNRIYITGLSMGGGGTYRFISRQQKQAASVAAAATICAPCTFTGDANNVAKANLPLWSFHAANDSVALALCTESAIRKVNAVNPAVKPLKTIWPTGGHNVWDRVYTDTAYKQNGIINIYEWFLGQNKSLKPNKLPVAKAGDDKKIHPSQGTVTLNASASYDSDGKIVRYVWKKIEGPNAVNIGQTMGTGSSTTVSGLKQGVYKFELAVVDNRASYTTDTIQITVDSSVIVTPPVTVPVDTTTKPTPPVKAPADTATKPAPPVKVPADTATKPAAPGTKPAEPVKKPVTKPNQPPIARTTQDRVIPIEWNYFPVVSGWPSTDADGYIARFTWHKVSGPDTFNIVSPNTCATRVNNLVPGVYVFRVTAYDNKGATSYADVKITMTKKEKKNSITAASSSSAVEEPATAVAANIPLTQVTIPLSMKMYPNPAVSLVNLEYSGSETGRGVIVIHDASGKLIKSIAFSKTGNMYRHNLDVSKLPDGLYYIEIRIGNNIGTQAKLVKKS